MGGGLRDTLCSQARSQWGRVDEWGEGCIEVGMGSVVVVVEGTVGGVEDVVAEVEDGARGRVVCDGCLEEKGECCCEFGCGVE